MWSDRFVARTLLVTLAALVVVVAWQSIPLIQSAVIGWSAEPRTVTPRGALADAETSTIAVFEAARDSVVSISTQERAVTPWSRNGQGVLAMVSAGGRIQRDIVSVAGDVREPVWSPYTRP